MAVHHTSVGRDSRETQEWLDSVDALVAMRGVRGAQPILDRAVERARQAGIEVGSSLTTDYVNTIPAESEAPFPGDEGVETRLRHYIRWNAAVMVARANRRVDGIGGHLATYASAATLYEVGFNHFFHGKTDDELRGPGVLPRPRVPRHLRPSVPRGPTQRVRSRRVPSRGRRRTASYPHPRRCDFWEFPTVSMGLGLINAAYQARFNRYLADRGIVDTAEARCGASPATARWTSPRASPAWRSPAGNNSTT